MQPREEHQAEAPLPADAGATLPKPSPSLDNMTMLSFSCLGLQHHIYLRHILSEKAKSLVRSERREEQVFVVGEGLRVAAEEAKRGRARRLLYSHTRHAPALYWLLRHG